MRKIDYKKLYYAEKEDAKWLRKENQELRNKCENKSRKLDIALNALTDIAAGLATAEKGTDWTHQTRMQKDAANALSMMAGML